MWHHYLSKPYNKRWRLVFRLSAHIRWALSYVDGFIPGCLPAISSFPAYTLKVSPFPKSLLCLNIRPISGHRTHSSNGINSTIYDPLTTALWMKPQNATATHTRRSLLKDARSVVCMHTNTGCRLELHLHGLRYSCRSQTVMQIEKTCCFLSPFFSLSKNHGVRVWMIFTGSTDGITSADTTQRPKSICLFSNRPSHGREETSAYHGSNGYVEGGVLKQAACSTVHYRRKKISGAADAM